MKVVEIPFSFSDTFFDSVKINVNGTVKIPLITSLNEVLYEFIIKHNIPEFSIESFKVFLTEFIENEISNYQFKLIKNCFDDVKDVSRISASISNLYYETWNDYNLPTPQSDFEIFGNAYVKLVESGTEGMESIARLELQFSRALSDKVVQRDLVLSNLDEKYMSSIKELENSVSINKQDDINRFEQQYYQNRLQMEINWNSDISALREEQKRDFRAFVMNASSSLLLNSADAPGEDTSPDISSGNQGLVSGQSQVAIKSKTPEKKNKNIARSKSSSIILSKLSDFNKKLGIKHDQALPNINNSNSGSKNTKKTSDVSQVFNDHSPWEESFTIHLGRQMRSTHNMKIICIDPMDLLSLSASSGDYNKTNELQPENIASRLTTALRLYSTNLTGMVLLVDNHLNTCNGMKNKFAHLCEMSTDFHFPQLEHQIDEIKKNFVATNQKSPNKSTKSSQCLEVGDVYITCHSNLNVVAVVFHLVVDESEIQKDIRYPSPIHNAIRNILRACFLHDIFCLNIPLLLSHSHKEYMTQSWCTRRGETILKAVKGAMMELCTWRGREPRTIQFIVPPGHSEEMLSSFSSLLTDYFQLSKVVK